MHSGHHTNYLLALVPAIRRLRVAKVIETAVIAITPHHYKLLDDQGELKGVGDSVEWDTSLPDTSPAPRLTERKELHRAIRRIVRHHRPDGFICTSADYDIIHNAFMNVFPWKS